MNEVAARAVRAEAARMKSPAELGLVLRVPDKLTEFLFAVCKLAFVAVFTLSVLFEGSTQFGLIPA